MLLDLPPMPSYIYLPRPALFRLFLRYEHGHELVQYVEDDEWRGRYAEHTAQTLLERLQVVRDYREVVVHETVERKRERLAADDDVPPHHEHPEQDQYRDEEGPPDRNAGEQQKDERDQVADAVLKDEYFKKSLW